MDPQSFSKLDPDRDPDPHSLKKLDPEPDPHKFNADPKYRLKPIDLEVYRLSIEFQTYWI
jgi:hypothetical protein